MNVNRLAAAGGAVALVLLLAGCASMEGEMTFDGEAKADGQLSISLNKQAASFVGISSLDSFENGLKDNAEADSALGGGKGDVSFTETDTDYVAKVTFEDADINDDEWVAKVTDDGNFTFSYTNEGMEDTESLGQDGDFGRVDLTVNFPGEVITFSGDGATKVDEDTIRWQFPISQTNTIAATSTIEVGSSLPPVILGGAALAVIAATGAGAWALTRRSRSTKANAENTGAIEELENA